MKYKLVFKIEEIEDEVSNFDNKVSKLDYLNFLRHEVEMISNKLTDTEILENFSSYNLLIKPVKEYDLDDVKPRMIKFKERLKNTIIPYIDNSIRILNNRFDNLKPSTKRKKLDKKYPTFDFRISDIISNCYNSYTYDEEKITYLELIIQRVQIDFHNDEGYFEWHYGRTIDSFVERIQLEIEKLKSEKSLSNRINNNNNSKPIAKKFKWQGTEKGLLLLFELLFASGFFHKEDYKIYAAILRDTFLNRDGKSFNNKQLNVTKMKIDNIFDKNVIIFEKDADISKFRKLISLLNDSIQS